ncbi:kinase-like domain-containing protein [Cladochytrium replicatum]|nr:kinase-like domain-containing protein [Cladochytrium replicatum]
MHAAVRAGAIEELKVLLKSSGGPSIDTRDDHEETVLHIACKKGNQEIVSWAVANGAQVDLKNVCGDTPLIHASKGGFLPIVEQLIALGADINAANDHGNTALHYACFWRREEVVTALLKAGSRLFRNKHGRVATDRTSRELASKVKDWVKRKDVPDSAARRYTSAKDEARVRFLLRTENNWEVNPKQIEVKEPLTEGGARAEVFKGVWNGCTVAIKRVVKQDPSPAELAALRCEVQSLRTLYDTNILPVLGACLTPPHVCIVTELMPNGNLQDHLYQPSIEIDQDAAFRLSREICKGMMFLHDQKPPVPHMNLTARNVLIASDGTLKLTDFGIRCSIFNWKSHSTQSRFLLNAEYIAPEVLMNGMPRVITGSDVITTKDDEDVKSSSQNQDHLKTVSKTLPSSSSIQHFNNLLAELDTQAQPKTMLPSKSIQHFEDLIADLDTTLETENVESQSANTTRGSRENLKARKKRAGGIVMREPPYADMNSMRLGMKVVLKDIRPIIPEFIPQNVAQIMMKCWNKDPFQRPPFRQLLNSLVLAAA